MTSLTTDEQKHCPNLGITRIVLVLLMHKRLLDVDALELV